MSIITTYNLGPIAALKRRCTVSELPITTSFTDFVTAVLGSSI